MRGHSSATGVSDAICPTDRLRYGGKNRTTGRRLTQTREPATGRDELREALRAIARGDRAAFEMLYVRTSAKLFGICLRILSKRSDAEEVLQETYTTVWRKAESYDAALSSPITWLVTIARIEAIDCSRTSESDWNVSNQLPR